MCGIFGVCIKSGASRKAVLQKFKILGLYNISRGKDASGVFINGEITKGIGKVSEFDDFIEETVLPLPKENSVMLGHTRQGSWGYKKTIDEAHPFLINEDLVLTHNGTIKNVDKLCELYKLDKTQYSVDTQVLATALDENGPMVLEEYVGAAALAFTRLSEPGTLYIYHGKSKDYKHGQPLEERPLYFMETKDGLFYSSLECSLEAIRDDEKDEPFNLKYNHLYKIVNGKFMIDETVEIKREEANVSTYVAPVVHVGKHHKALTTNSTVITGDSGSNLSSKGASIKEQNLVRRESLPLRVIEAKEKKGFVYYHLGRYWEAPRKLLQGPVYLKKGGLFGNFEDKVSELLFFWQGVMLHSKGAYVELQKLEDEKILENWVRQPHKNNFALNISSFSPNPVTNIGSEGFNLSGFYRHQWYQGGGSCKSGKVAPKFASGRNYQFDNGFLIDIKPSQREKTIFATEDLAKAEIEALVNGGLLTGVPGGGSQVTPFQAGNGTITENKGKSFDEIVWYFDVPFTNYEEASKVLGKDELESLKEYVRKMCKKQFSLDPLDKEVEMGVASMIKTATDRQCTLLDTITDEADKYTLMACYEEAIDKANKEIFKREASMQSAIIFTDEHNAGKDSIESKLLSIEEDVEQMEPEEIEDLVESSIVDLENLQITSMELMDAQESDYAQECANILITGVNGMLSNMEGVLQTHGKQEFLARVKKIRETKSMKDGVL